MSSTAHLVELQAKITARLEAVQADLQKAYSADSAEQAQQRENDEVLQDLAKQLKEELQQIKTALQRDAKGLYGICDSCGEAIAPQRLQLLPFALQCHHCAK